MPTTRKSHEKIKCTCETCGKIFYVSPSIIRQGQGKHCSQKCRRNKKEIPCDFCGKIIYRSPSTTQKHNFCSRECKNLFRKNQPKEEKIRYKNGENLETRTCKACGKEFRIEKSRIKDGQGMYCSKYCSAHRSGKNNPNFKRVRVPCKRCETIINVIPYRLKISKSGELFCSSDCKNLWISESAGTDKHPSFKSKFVNCTICGKEFKLTPHWEKLGRTKYCSQECYWKDLPNLITGENHPNYIGGSKIYCEKFNAEFKIRQRKFNNNCCVECGKTPDENGLHVHHVYYDKKACCNISEDGVYYSNLGIKNNPSTFKIIGDPNKFVSLCQSCHSKTTNKKYREKWARHFEEIVNNKFGGKSYYTKEEMVDMGYVLKFRNKWVLANEEKL